MDIDINEMSDNVDCVLQAEVVHLPVGETAVRLGMEI